MKCSQLAEIGFAIQQIMAKPIKAKVAMRIAVATKGVRELYNEFDARRTETAKKYGAPNGQGGFSVTEPGKITEYVAEFNELLEDEVEVPEFKIRLADIEELELPGHVIATLEPYLEI